MHGVTTSAERTPPYCKKRKLVFQRQTGAGKKRSSEQHLLLKLLDQLLTELKKKRIFFLFPLFLAKKKKGMRNKHQCKHNNSREKERSMQTAKPSVLYLNHTTTRKRNTLNTQIITITRTFDALKSQFYQITCKTAERKKKKKEDCCFETRHFFFVAFNSLSLVTHHKRIGCSLFFSFLLLLLFCGGGHFFLLLSFLYRSGTGART